MKPQLRQAHCIWYSLLCSLLVCCAATAQVPQAAFEVATVKPAPGADPNTGYWSYSGIRRFTASHVSLALLIQLAYSVDKSQIASKPDWLDTTLYDIDAKPESGITLTRDELRPRLQDLLKQRFHLAVHTETRLSRGYALTVAEGGPRLTATTHEQFRGDFLDVSPGQMRGYHWTMAQLARYLTPPAGYPVVDQTRLAGSYDISFSYESKPDVNDTLPPLDVALKKATGLLLKPQRVPVEMIVIDFVDKVPTEN